MRTVSRSVVVRRPYDEIASFVTDPDRVLAVIPGFARFNQVADAPAREDSAQEWDIFLEVGTLHIGGRVLVTRPAPNRLEWHSVRGTRHTFAMVVEPEGVASVRLTMTMGYRFTGLLMARVTEALAEGIAARHLEAGLQEIRHLLEYGDAVPLL